MGLIYLDPATRNLIFQVLFGSWKVEGRKENAHFTMPNIIELLRISSNAMTEPQSRTSSYLLLAAELEEVLLRYLFVVAILPILWKKGKRMC